MSDASKALANKYIPTCGVLSGTLVDNLPTISALNVTTFPALSSSIPSLRESNRKLVTLTFDNIAIRAHNRKQLRGMMDYTDADNATVEASTTAIIQREGRVPISLISGVHIYIPDQHNRLPNDAQTLRNVFREAQSLGRPVYVYHNIYDYINFTYSEAEGMLDNDLDSHHPEDVVHTEIWPLHAYRCLLTATTKRNIKELLFSPVSEVRVLTADLRRDAKHSSKLIQRGVNLLRTCKNIECQLDGDRKSVNVHHQREARALFGLCKENDIEVQDLPSYLAAQIVNDLGREL